MIDIPRAQGSGHAGEGEAPSDDGTLGGYLQAHRRPPAFLGSDGYPYTVSLEVEQTPHLRTPYSGYLVFPRWADSGAGVIGHLETPLLHHGKTREEVQRTLEAMTLPQVNELLRAAILDREQETD